MAVRMTADAFGRHGEYCFRLPLGSDGSGLAPAGGKHQFIREDIGWLTQLPASAGTCAMNREENDPMLELSAYPSPGQLRIYDIEAISLPIVYNRFGDHDPNGLLYVLKQDS